MDELSQIRELRRGLPAPDEASWARARLALESGMQAVQASRKPRPRHREPRWQALALAVFALLAVLVAGPALGLYSPVVDFFASEPAATPVQEDFASLDVAAPEGMAPGVIEGEARKVMEVELSAGRSTLWVAPTKSGGFCTTWSRGAGGGCRSRGLPAGFRDRPGDRDAHLIGAGFTLGFAGREAYARIISGSILAPEAESLELRYEDGSSAEIPFVWVSAPIEAGFYLYEVPQAARQVGHRPQTLLLKDKDGKNLARQAVEYPDTQLLPDPQTGLPPAVILERKRPLIEIQSEAGSKETLWAAPSRLGGECHWLTSNGRVGRAIYGCRPSEQAIPPLALGQLSGSAPVLLAGQVGKDVSSVSLRFQDGDSVSLKPVEAWLLYEIPSEHYPPGHRLSLVRALDARGQEIAREPWHTKDVGVYPCDKPAQLGHGVEACP